MNILPYFRPPSIKTLKKALCIQPHPDDNEVGMGGVIAYLAERGCEIHYLTMTDGSLGAPDESYTPERLAAARKEEAEASGLFLGASKFFWLNHEDGTLNNVPALAAQIAELIRSEKYEAVFCPDAWLPYEAHNDHVTTGRAAAQAVLMSGLPNCPRGTKTAPHQPSAIGFYYTAKPNTVVNVSKTFQKKMDALALHKTQINDELLGLYRIYFKLQGVKLAFFKPFFIGEGLKVLAPLHLHCFTGAYKI
ncbi:MAG TPA: PIG-L family deacetylase [Clostridia bacterium]|nr:PIG-L family deacetylase [Clostridia bacterium]